MNKTRNTVKIFGLGGCGTNIVLGTEIPAGATGFATFEKIVFDTSRSNLRNNDNVKHFIIPGSDGTGKDQKLAHDLGKQYIDQLLLENEPADFNILVASASGGTGSVLSLIAGSEILKRGKAVVFILVTSSASELETSNSLKTVKNYYRQARVLKQPIICSLHMNTSSKSRDTVNREASVVIKSLTLLLSGVNGELDRTDLSNWLNYTRVVGMQPSFMELHIVLDDGSEEISTKLPDAQPVSVANLLPDTSHQELLLGQPYSCTGIMPQGFLNATTNDKYPMYFLITPPINIVGELENKSNEFEKTRIELNNAQVKATAFDDGDELVF